MTWGIWWTPLEHSKILKFALWETFLFKVYIVWVKKILRSYVSWHWSVMQYVKEKLTGGCKNDSRNLVNFHISSQKSGNLYFDGLLLSIAYKFWAKKVKKSYLSWHKRVTQSLKKNTPRPSAPVKCALVASPVDKFAEIVSPVPNYASPDNKWISFLPGHKETLSPVITGTTGGPHWNKVFSAWSYVLV